MKNETIEISYTAYLAKPDIWPYEGEKLGDYSSLEELNKYLESAHLDAMQSDMIVGIEMQGLLDGMYSFSAGCYELKDRKAATEEQQKDIRRVIDKVSPITLNIIKNDDVDVDYIPFHFNVRVKDSDDKQIFEGEFPNFYRINEFILSTMNTPEYKDVIAEIWPMEVVGDGICDGGGYWYELERYDVITEETAERIKDYIRETIDDLEETGHHVNSALRPDMYEEPEDYHRKESVRSEFVYICPNCLHEVNDCRCENYPWTAVQIDKVLHPSIYELNWKGYRTAYCCAGHRSGEKMSIVFQHNYLFTKIPEGFYYSWSTFELFKPCPEGLSDEEYKTFRQESADSLLEWAESLRVNLCHADGY